jgi:phage shock protein E
MLTLPKQTLLQLVAILSLSVSLGAVFNAANPIGVRLKERGKGLDQGSAMTDSGSVPRPAPTPLSQPRYSGSITPDSRSFAPITWEEVKPLLLGSRAVLVDARPAKTHALYSIPNSVSLPFDSSTNDLTAFREKFPIDSHLIIYCSHESCLASQHLAEKLAPLGYKTLHIMKEGYFGWLRKEKGEASVAISKGDEANSGHSPITPLVQSHSSQNAHAAGRSASINWLGAKPLIDSGSAVLVDVRATSLFAAGHIPGAVNLPPETLISFRDSEFHRKYAASTPLILYCNSDTCPVSKRVAERLVSEFGYQTVYYMSGGYAEWQRESVGTP